MITTFDINDILYPMLNTALVLDTLDDGRVYRNKKPLNSELQDIVIIPLSNYVGDEIINNATFMINCYCKNFDNGTPDITKLKAIINEVVVVIEAYNNTSNYYVFEITNQILLQDTDQKSMSYVNLRINCFIEK
ncbi:hypothetical protein ES695_06380 [Candidatus Atribacteria bacterium 1244-E10-H5-B2]|nr:MAG: hypothetical protein ES695_06380 [Candidatus Atribacteria bacterium 1244-E10-H5-B2]